MTPNPELKDSCAQTADISLAPTNALQVSRRTFLAGSAAVSAALTLPHAAAQALEDKTTALVEVQLRVNGTARALRIEPRVSLLDALREQIGLTGTKKGCNQGACGACTVWVDGVRINSCLTLAVMHQGQEITTVEGLAQGDKLHPMQAAFIEHEGFQCGYCTSGQIMSAVACIKEGHAGSGSEIREWMSGNICRCGAYNGIVEAIQDVKGGDHASL